MGILTIHVKEKNPVELLYRIYSIERGHLDAPGKAAGNMGTRRLSSALAASVTVPNP
jgi:hypothetical protein